ncbi:MAG: hypothetical protein E6682_15335 [Clostridium perfringens]|uniref:hypothetical protein n=2 Tax=Clostridium perfringens TaxID=1502 RepID=UPI0018AA7D96|nr:hypothetical protein [Clostridium perfringens]UVX36144.1 MAG: hypothetical protein [Bacteriophage sp.]EGT3604700.1 hypothetical protein [Clostridium perfringens]EHR1329633.1 hypothetical protein [Clostridium perfringens]EHR1332759.1 hypothetical protein [Clostridium perfringens]EHR1426309.1 hypothetical protein [Clostridium perfringens]
MRYFDRLEKFIKENNIKFIKEIDVREDLERLGYEAKKNTWKKVLENNEVDYFKVGDLNRRLNKLGFEKNAKFKVWYKGEEGLKRLGNIYSDEMYELGAERYCLDDIDDYIDDPREELEESYFHYKMIEEIGEFARERGLSFNSGLEYIILDYFKKERTQDTYLKNLKEELEEGYYNDEEKEYLIALYKKDKEAFREKTNYEEYLEGLYIDTLISKGLTRYEIEELKKIDNDPEFLCGCYIRSLEHEKITLDLVIDEHNEFTAENYICVQ